MHEYFCDVMIILLLFPTQPSNCQVSGIYCGQLNCYDVLQVTRDDDRTKIRKTYRELALKHHPDRQKTIEDRLKAEDLFRTINAAYEVLSDPEQRKEYDFMLDNPNKMIYNYYQYYRRRYGPNVDVRLVILSIILIISAVQYVGQRTIYNQALDYLLKNPKHRTRAKQLVSANNSSTLVKRESGRRLTRDELKEREEELLRAVIKDTVDLKGDISKPSLQKVLFVQLLLLPWYLLKISYWYSKWVYLYWILRKPYDEEAKVYLTRKCIGLSATAWEGLEETKKSHFLASELWIKSNYQRYATEQEEKGRIQAAENTHFKRYRRFVKKTGGIPQASMNDLE